VTIEDRLAKGRLEAARAYIEGLLACPEGRGDPRVHLAMAVIDERRGALNDAAEGLLRAEVLDGSTGPHHGAIRDARQAFEARWVQLVLVPDSAVSGPDSLEYAGLVMDDATEACLTELERVVGQSTGGDLTRVVWLVPGLYRLNGETVELAAGEHVLLRLPAPPAPAGGGP